MHMMTLFHSNKSNENLKSDGFLKKVLSLVTKDESTIDEIESRLHEVRKQKNEVIEEICNFRLMKKNLQEKHVNELEKINNNQEGLPYTKIVLLNLFISPLVGIPYLISCAIARKNALQKAIDDENSVYQFKIEQCEKTLAVLVKTEEHLKDRIAILGEIKEAYIETNDEALIEKLKEYWRSYQNIIGLETKYIWMSRIALMIFIVCAFKYFSGYFLSQDVQATSPRLNY